ncbi:N-acetyl sugar amidotransferase [bacterium]|nr:N-acetyl sugar amidotransferase [bacterium]
MHKICARCVMDTTDPDIRFDSQGVCNYCLDWDRVRPRRPYTQEDVDRRLARIADEIKRAGRGREYDCVLGISGGVDSAYTCHLAKQLGLRPLVVHCDNGWNSDIAVENIANLLKGCDYDLYTVVIDWEEFLDLQRSFIRASVMDIEILTDHAMFATIFNVAQKHQLRYSLTGCNTATESNMPPTWNWMKSDLRNIKAIHRRYGRVPLKTFPMLNFWKWFAYDRLGLMCKSVPILDSTLYRRDEALRVLRENYGFRGYGAKHYESTFTKFYQAYILPQKFGIDKRKLHLSSLVTNGELTREEALAELEKPLYTELELRREKDYVLKKLGFSESEFDEIMRLPPVPHSAYPTDRPIFDLIRKVYLTLRRLIRG